MGQNPILKERRETLKPDYNEVREWEIFFSKFPPDYINSQIDLARKKKKEKDSIFYDELIEGAKRALKTPFC